MGCVQGTTVWNLMLCDISVSHWSVMTWCYCQWDFDISWSPCRLLKTVTDISNLQRYKEGEMKCVTCYKKGIDGHLSGNSAKKVRNKGFLAVTFHSLNNSLLFDGVAIPQGLAAHMRCIRTGFTGEPWVILTGYSYCHSTHATCN